MLSNLQYVNKAAIYMKKIDLLGQFEALFNEPENNDVSDAI